MQDLTPNFLLPTLRDWYVQAGAGAMDATDTTNLGDFMLGGAGNDVILNGAANDAGYGNAFARRAA